MTIFRPRTNGELYEALAHLHFMTRLYFVERTGEGRFDDPGRPTVNRFLDVVRSGDPGAICRVEGPGGPRAVVAVLLGPEGVSLVVDPANPTD